ncbi:GAF and ANTAR domain-containing protein [Pseudonocardia lacus]|uniref:GAF and ANTAR domain-containing protein n=1 Tax=Pseudonocardia lacus TaxID=2835865 RepID=UPI001BDBB94A|nr:GAF and ANTAR domain-containing protein [Pseudonocardia lacus]
MGELGPVTTELLGVVRDGTDDKALAARICQACVRGLGVDGAALSLLTATEARQTLWATDPVAERLEELQFTLNEGACMEAARTGAPVLVPDLHHCTRTTRWPLFAAAVGEQTAVAALFALPLQWGAINLGVLDLYRAVPGALSEAERLDALAAADTAALMLLDQRTDPDNRFGGWLDHALGSRAEIHQATGMVLVQLAVSAEDALARMRAHAFVHQRLLIEVARDVVARRLVFTEDMM